MFYRWRRSDIDQFWDAPHSTKYAKYLVMDNNKKPGKSFIRVFVALWIILSEIWRKRRTSTSKCYFLPFWYHFDRLPKPTNPLMLTYSVFTKLYFILLEYVKKVEHFLMHASSSMLKNVVSLYLMKETK